MRLIIKISIKSGTEHSCLSCYTLSIEKIAKNLNIDNSTVSQIEKVVVHIKACCVDVSFIKRKNESLLRCKFLA